MASSFQLLKYDVVISNSGNTAVLIKGPKLYYDLVIDTFPTLKFSPVWLDKYNKYDYGFFVNGIGDVEREGLRILLDLFCSVVCIDDRLPQTFALDYHYLPVYDTGRTQIGELMYQAKYQYDRKSAYELVEHFVHFISCHPAYKGSDSIIATPPSKPNKPFDLPSFIVDEICQNLQLNNGNYLVKKVKETAEMKNASPEEKFENMLGAFGLTNDTVLRGKVITIIDDIYYSGTTLLELALTINRAGAKVRGLVATKAKRRDD